MSAFYVPKGRAREYSPLALNLYTGCDHGCNYCYAPAALKKTAEEFADVKPRANARHDIAAGAKKYANSPDQVLMSFIGDPYCQAEESYGLTRYALECCLENRIPVAILTKGGLRSLRDLDLFKAFGPHIKVGATLTFLSPSLSARYEPGAAMPEFRLEALAEIHRAGVRTWASIEPVMDPRESLGMIRTAVPWVDEFKLGKLNHDKEREASIDWYRYLYEAVDVLERARKPYYVKQDLRDAVPEMDFSPLKKDMNVLNLPAFPRVRA